MFSIPKNNILLIFVTALLGIAIGIFIGPSVTGLDTISIDQNQTITPKGDFISPGISISLSNESFFILDKEGQSGYFIDQNANISGVITRDLAEPYGYWQISGAAADSQDNLYLSDSATHQIYKFSKGSRLLTRFGEFGQNHGQLDTPRGLSVVNASDSEFLYVSDSGNKRIQVFTLEGLWVKSIQIPLHDKIPALIQTVKERSSERADTKVQEYTINPVNNPHPPFVTRTFELSSSGKRLPLSFEVNRSMLLGAQQISYKTNEILQKNPEQWLPVLRQFLTDPATRDTLNTTLTELNREANINRLNEQKRLESIIHFVQQIPLTDETDNRYPIEILYSKKGNTYDKALYLYGLLDAAGYDVVYLVYPGQSHAAVGIRLKSHVEDSAVQTYQDCDEHPYIYVSADGPSFIGAMAAKYKRIDPYVLHLTEKPEFAKQVSANHLYAVYVVESIISLAEKYQFLIDNEKQTRGDEARAIREKYQRIKSVLDYVEKNPWNTELAYMRIKNSKVNEIGI